MAPTVSTSPWLTRRRWRTAWLCCHFNFSRRKSMDRKFSLILLIAVFVMATPCWAQAPQVVAVRAGHLFDSKSGQMLTNQIVLINGEKITEVGAADRVQIPSGAQVIDLSQATVMPGFVDAHTHLYSSLSN